VTLRYASSASSDIERIVVFEVVRKVVPGMTTSVVTVYAVTAKLVSVRESVNLVDSPPIVSKGESIVRIKNIQLPSSVGLHPTIVPSPSYAYG